MSAYIKLSTLEYPRHEGDIRIEYPDMGEEFSCPNSYALVEWVDAPTIDHSTQLAYEAPPQLINGAWTMVWAVRDLTADEIAHRQAVVAERMRT